MHGLPGWISNSFRLGTRSGDAFTCTCWRGQLQDQKLPSMESLGQLNTLSVPPACSVAGYSPAACLYL